MTYLKALGVLCIIVPWVIGVGTIIQWCIDHCYTKKRLKIVKCNTGGLSFATVDAYTGEVLGLHMNKKDALAFVDYYEEKLN